MEFSYPRELSLKVARNLAVIGLSDAGIAFVLFDTLDDFAEMRDHDAEFREAIRPSIQEIHAYEARVLARKQSKKRCRIQSATVRPALRVLAATRSRLWAALKGKSDGRLFSRLGYSCNDLCDHLEALFQPGMSWENYGKWHVDHIKPCVLFDQLDPTAFLKCWSMSNLQPLWASDNCRKGSSYVGS